MRLNRVSIIVAALIGVVVCLYLLGTLVSR